jgi:hypothetical protein
MESLQEMTVPFRLLDVAEWTNFRVLSKVIVESFQLNSSDVQPYREAEE